MNMAELKPRYRFDDTANFEMFLSDKQWDAYFCNGVVEWYDPEDVTGYRCKGLVASTFPRAHGGAGSVPFKYTEQNHVPALDGYCRAFLSGAVTGPPKYLLIAKMDLDEFHNCIEQGSIIVRANMYTLQFMLDVTQESYPSLEMETMVGEAMVEAFYEMTDLLRETRSKKRGRLERP